MVNGNCVVVNCTNSRYQLKLWEEKICEVCLFWCYAKASLSEPKPPSANNNKAEWPKNTESDGSIDNRAEASQIFEVTTVSAASNSPPNFINGQLSPSGCDTGNVKRRTKTKTPSQGRNKGTGVTMGDSLIKNINGWELKEKCRNHRINIFVKNFNGAATREMYSYAQPSIERKPNLILLHTGTNDLH